MTDIVQLLRGYESIDDYSVDKHAGINYPPLSGLSKPPVRATNTLYLAAAIEIERLRAELADCRAWLKHYERSDPPSVKQAIALARDEAYERAAELCEKYPRFNWASENAERDHIQNEWGVILASRVRSLKSKP